MIDLTVSEIILMTGYALATIGFFYQLNRKKKLKREMQCQQETFQSIIAGRDYELEYVHKSYKDIITKIQTIAKVEYYKERLKDITMEKSALEIFRETFIPKSGISLNFGEDVLIENPSPHFEEADLMPFGKHKGKELDKVPDTYVMWAQRRGFLSDKLQAEFLKLGKIK